MGRSLLVMTGGIKPWFITHEKALHTQGPPDLHRKGPLFVGPLRSVRQGRAEETFPNPGPACLGASHRKPASETQMKILILIILLNAQTGDIEQGAIIGTAPDSATCMQVAAKAIDNTKAEIGARVPFPVCIDIEPMIPAPQKTKNVERL